MTAASVSPTEIASVLDVLPDYSRYDREDWAQDSESPYRLALGRIAKEWGDQLLDIVESRPNPLSRTQTGMIDTLLHGIGEIFRALNAAGEIQPADLDARTLKAMRRCDGDLLESLESAQRRMEGLKQRDFAGVWVDANAKGLAKGLAHIYKRLAQRNEMLGFQESRHLEEFDPKPVPGGLA